MEKINLEVGLKFKSNYKPGITLEITKIDKWWVYVKLVKIGATWFDKMSIGILISQFEKGICQVAEVPVKKVEVTIQETVTEPKVEFQPVDNLESETPILEETKSEETKSEEESK